MLGAEVDLHQVDNSVFAVETMLKLWLHEQGGDKEHLHLLLPSSQKNPSPGLIHTPTATPLTMSDTKLNCNCFSSASCAVCIKCDMQERLISPALIPLTPNLGVKTESVRDFVSFTKGSANQSQEPQTLKAIK